MAHLCGFWAGGPDNRVHLIFEGAPSKLAGGPFKPFFGFEKGGSRWGAPLFRVAILSPRLLGSPDEASGATWVWLGKLALFFAFHTSGLPRGPS
jgi:hypothetical protein